MSGKYTNNLQAALLFEGGREINPAEDLNAFRMALLARQMPLNIVQQERNFAMMMGPGELQLHVTHYDRPADHAVFAQTLRSGLTNALMADAEQRVSRHTSHVLVEIHHGVLGGIANNPQVAGLFDKLGMKKPGHSLGEFNLRVDLLGEVCRHLLKAQPASAVHWTQSNMLIAGEKFEAFFEQPHPSMLTIHPILLAQDPSPRFKEIPVAILTLGAADYIGQEIFIKAAPVPWFELFETALAFTRIAIMPNGYIIPNEETFGPESGEFSYRVRHIPGDRSPVPTGEPCYELTLLFHKKFGYTSQEFQPRTLVQGGVPAAAAMLDPRDKNRHATIAGWRKSDRLATGAGGRFEICRKEGVAAGGPNRFGQGERGFGRRATFGKKH